MRRNPGKLRLVYPGLQVQRHMLPRNKEILVVDGQRGSIVVRPLFLRLLLLRHGRRSAAYFQTKNQQQRKQNHSQRKPQQFLHEILPKMWTWKGKGLRSYPENVGGT